jgi:hypothetical protein
VIGLRVLLLAGDDPLLRDASLRAALGSRGVHLKDLRGMRIAPLVGGRMRGARILHVHGLLPVEERRLAGFLRAARFLGMRFVWSLTRPPALPMQARQVEDMRTLFLAARVRLAFTDAARLRLEETLGLGGSLFTVPTSDPSRAADALVAAYETSMEPRHPTLDRSRPGER